MSLAAPESAHKYAKLSFFEIVSSTGLGVKGMEHTTQRTCPEPPSCLKPQLFKIEQTSLACPN